MTRARGARFDQLHRAGFAAGRHDWNDARAAVEVLGHLDGLLRRTGATGGELLELGCGTGTLSFPLAARGHRVTGLDIAPAAVAHARRRAAATRARAVFLVHDITEPLPALAGRFALVVDSLALHCLTTTAARLGALRLARSALAPGGALLVMTRCGAPRRVPPGSRFDPRTRRLVTGGVAEGCYASPDDLGRLLRDAGFRASHTTIAEGSPTTGDQDLYLAVLHPTGTSGWETLPGR